MTRQQIPICRGRRARSGGYTLAVLLVMMVALGVFMQRAHLWAPTQINREREAELIYRGEHLARGIAVFRQRTGRYPTTLEELESFRPRLVRKIYKDPISPTGEWIFLYNVPTSTSGNNEGLPIIGVRSSSFKDSIKRYQFKSMHSDWEFSALDPLLGGPPPGQGIPDPNERRTTERLNNESSGTETKKEE